MVAIVTGLAALPLITFSMLGFDITSQMTSRAEVSNIAEAACDRATSAFFNGQTDQARRDAAQQVIDRAIGETGLDISSGFARAEIAAAGVQVAISGKLSSIMPVSAGNTDISMTVPCDNRPSANPISNLVFFEGFEAPTVRSSGYTRWFIEPNLPGWTLVSGTGVQLNDNNLIPGLAAPEGQQFGELAGDSARGGIGGRTGLSVISRNEILQPGRYRLSYLYHANTRNVGPADQIVNVYVDPDDGSRLMTSLVMTKNDSTGWEEQAYEFDVASAGGYRFTFQADGGIRDWGAYVDSIELVRLP